MNSLGSLGSMPRQRRTGAPCSNPRRSPVRPPGAARRDAGTGAGGCGCGCRAGEGEALVDRSESRAQQGADSGWGGLPTPRVGARYGAARVRVAVQAARRRSLRSRTRSPVSRLGAPFASTTTPGTGAIGRDNPTLTTSAAAFRRSAALVREFANRFEDDRGWFRGRVWHRRSAARVSTAGTCTRRQSWRTGRRNRGIVIGWTMRDPCRVRGQVWPLFESPVVARFSRPSDWTHLLPRKCDWSLDF